MVAPQPEVPPGVSPDVSSDVEALARFLEARRRVVALTGAGLSTASGIPDYRDADGAWKRSPPVQYLDFVRSGAVRRRYWARSMVGWESFSRAAPNEGHAALARLEATGPIDHVITQNVDGLHQKAGALSVTDLHGRLEDVECLACRRRLSRHTMQARLRDANPDAAGRTAPAAPDGDADLIPEGDAAFHVPDCPACGGILKPAVVFFGESVPRERVEAGYARVAAADAMLVVGSSLMVFSGLRFVRAARNRGVPVAILNLGRTRADDVAALKVARPCGEVLARLAHRLAG